MTALRISETRRLFRLNLNRPAMRSWSLALGVAVCCWACSDGEGAPMAGGSGGGSSSGMASAVAGTSAASSGAAASGGGAVAAGGAVPAAGGGTPEPGRGGASASASGGITTVAGGGGAPSGFSGAASSDGGPLRDVDGQVLRGTRLVVGRPYAQTTTAEARDSATWKKIKAEHLNTVRAVWVDPFVKDDPNWQAAPGQPPSYWSVDEVLPIYDELAQLAQTENVNLIIDYHNVGEYVKHQDFGEMVEFWAKIAPRHAKNPRVFFELNNEQAYASADYLQAIKDSTQKIYEQVHEDAPEREVILFSFNNLSFDMVQLANAYAFVDWSKTSVGYHMYGPGDGPGAPAAAAELDGLKALIASHYRTICTEWDYPTTGATWTRTYNGHTYNAQDLEELKQPWVDWAAWDRVSPSNVEDLLLPDALAKGYAWW